MLITGTGGTDYHPNVQSDVETVVVSAMVLIGVLLWAYVLSQVRSRACVLAHPRAGERVRAWRACARLS